MSFLQGSSTFAIITGASRGIGRAVAIQLARKVGPSSAIYLIARSEDALKETAEIINKESKETLDVKCFPSDLSNEADVQNLVESLFTDIGDDSKFAHVILVHNAASISNVRQCARDLINIEFIQKYFALTYTSTIVLTSAVLRHFSDSPGVKKTVVQMTSNAGTTPYPNLQLYCMGKAGRDMFFKVMALEEPEVRILAYDPGFVDTPMFDQIKDIADDGVKALCLSISSNKSIFLSPEQSAEALMKAMEEDKYESGATVRCYDVLDFDIDSTMKQILDPKK